MAVLDIFCISDQNTYKNNSMEESLIFWLAISEPSARGCSAPWAWLEHHSGRTMSCGVDSSPWNKQRAEHGARIETRHQDIPRTWPHEPFVPMRLQFFGFLGPSRITAWAGDKLLTPQPVGHISHWNYHSNISEQSLPSPKSTRLFYGISYQVYKFRLYILLLISVCATRCKLESVTEIWICCKTQAGVRCWDINVNISGRHHAGGTAVGKWASWRWHAIVHGCHECLLERQGPRDFVSRLLLAANVPSQVCRCCIPRIAEVKLKRRICLIVKTARGIQWASTSYTRRQNRLGTSLWSRQTFIPG